MLAQINYYLDYINARQRGVNALNLTRCYGTLLSFRLILKFEIDRKRSLQQQQPTEEQNDIHVNPKKEPPNISTLETN